ncbi:MAG: hypothetical protein P1V35_07000 [Planctomycetota bacterium]|nr:hypothetical protein [Planctomycetota bacterium]
MSDLAWDRPFAVWLLPLLAVAWWLLVVARRPKPQFTGSHALWSVDEGKAAEGSKRGFWPARFWELGAMALALLALAGPSLKSKDQEVTWTVLVDRSASMYLDHGTEKGITRMDRALQRLRDWDLSGSTQFVDAGLLDFGVFQQWPEAWKSAPRARRKPVAWSHWDRPNVLWMTDDANGLDPVHASLIASGGQYQPGPVALADQGILIEGEGGIRFDGDVPAMSVGGGDSWPQPWSGYAKLWCEDRGLIWSPNRVPGVFEALHLALMEASHPGEALVFDLNMGAYRMEGTCRPSPASRERLSTDGKVSPWALEAVGARHELIASEPGLLRLGVVDWKPVQGDLAAFAMDFARILDGARVLPDFVVPSSERGAAMAREVRAGRFLEGPDGEKMTSSPWAPWLSVGALLCLLASFGMGYSRSPRDR